VSCEVEASFDSALIEDFDTLCLSYVFLASDKLTC